MNFESMPAFAFNLGYQNFCNDSFVAPLKKYSYNLLME